MVDRASRSYLSLIILLAAIWGASYLFIKVGIRDFEPTVFVTLRLLLGGLLLLAFLMAREGSGKALRDVRAAWREGIVFGTINGVIPFTLITWGEKHIDSGVAAIANASVPIFVALLAIHSTPASARRREARRDPRRAGRRRRDRGVHPSGGSWAVIGTLAVVLASFSYACGGLYGQRALGQRPGPVLATASMLYGGLIVLPFALFQLPDHAPGWKPVLSLLGIAVLGTAVAQLILFRVLRLFGAARLSLVTYLMPAFALFYGSLILNEPLRPTMLIGLGLILGGVALGSGVWRPARRRFAAESSM